MTEDELTDFFKDAGKVTDIRWYEKDGEFKGMGWVTFDSDAAVEKAIAKNGIQFGGRPIRVDYAQS